MRFTLQCVCVCESRGLPFQVEVSGAHPSAAPTRYARRLLQHLAVVHTRPVPVAVHLGLVDQREPDVEARPLDLGELAKALENLPPVSLPS